MRRTFPPVYSPVRLRSLVRALGAVIREHNGEAYRDEPWGECFGGRRVLLTDSCTGALTLALRHTGSANAAPLVALPAYACPDVATAAIGAGGRIALYDIDPHSLSPDWDSVLRCLMAGATHLVVAHLFGRVVDVSIASDLAKRYGAVLVEDAAQGAGGSRNGIPAGKLAGISVLSFGRGKGLNSGGGGALSVTSGDWEPFRTEFPQNIPMPGQRAALAALARVAVVQWLSQPWIYAWPSRIPTLAIGQTVYREPQPVRAPDAATRVLITEALELSSTLLPTRQEAEAWYYRELIEWPDILITAPADGERSGALRFPIRIAPEMAAALRRFGAARSYPRTLRDYPEIAPHLTGISNTCAGAQELARNLHTLPTHGLMQERDRRELVHALVRTITRR